MLELPLPEAAWSNWCLPAGSLVGCLKERVFIQMLIYNTIYGFIDLDGNLSFCVLNF